MDRLTRICQLHTLLSVTGTSPSRALFPPPINLKPHFFQDPSCHMYPGEFTGTYA